MIAKYGHTWEGMRGRKLANWRGGKWVVVGKGSGGAGENHCTSQVPMLKTFCYVTRQVAKKGDDGVRGEMRGA